jgi:acetyltransferase
VADAAATIRRSIVGGPPGRASVEGVDRILVRDVLFGPGRALSDPASKSALAPYGVPVPVEELCASPSRAAAEATRIGFPVKLSLASPDLRVWDHPDLVVLGAASAAAVRDGFRTITSMAAERDPSARLLGVHVTAEAAASLTVRATLRPIAEVWTLCEISRTDDPGRSTLCALPTTPDRARATLVRLGIAPPRGRAPLESLVDALNRMAVFAADQRDAVTSVRIDPLAMLVGGGVEVREACVVVNDLFERSLGAA